MKLGILTGYHEWQSYIEACKQLGVDYEIVDILSADWMSNLKSAVNRIDGFCARPTCGFQELKTIYDERLHFIAEYFKKPICPNYNSLYIYESKRNMAAFLEFFDVPHSKTMVFIDKNEAIEYLKRAKYPLVQKANIGAGGSAVTILRNSSQAVSMANKVFGYRNGLICRGVAPCAKKFGIPIRLSGAEQKHYMIVQEFHKIKWEWRILKIGNSYFGHQKLLKGDKASGSGLVGWVEPPLNVLMMAKDICDKGGFDVMDVDIFETVDGQFLVNELQTIFGSYLPYQMKINDRSGRFVYSDESGFVFEEGEFNQLHSKLLIVENFVNRLKQK